MAYRIPAAILLALLPGAAAATAVSGSAPEIHAARAVTNAAASICRDILPVIPPGSAIRTAKPDDLMALRDFGASAVLDSLAPGFAMSPGGTHLAVQIRQAVPSENDYCLALLLFDLRNPESDPTILDLGGELIRDTAEVYGLTRFPTGMAAPLTPKWSHDGRWIAFMRRDQGENRLHIISLETLQSKGFSRAGADVVEFEWDAGKPELTVTFADHETPDLRRYRNEGRSGFRYDSRFWMLATTEPLEESPINTQQFRLDLFGSDKWQDARFAIIGSPSTSAEKPARGAWVEVDPEPAGAYHMRVHARLDGREIACRFEVCKGATAAWMQHDDDLIVYFRRQGFASAATGIYVWRPGEGPPTQIAETQDAFTGCELRGRLVCGRETSLRPRDIVEVDLQSGRIQALVNLNPEWASLKLGKVTRLHWVNRFGIESIGDLVMPPNAKPDKRYPLVIVQYATRGFLRGGVGDEYPIQAIAASDVAVLSVSRPMDYGVAMARAGKRVSKQNLVNLRLDRASAHDSILQAIAKASQAAPIDGDHIAISGLSDGASSATYALIHSNLFSLALLSTCCEDPQITMTSIGPRYERWMEQQGYHYPQWDTAAGWRRTSLGMNARRICARVVIQTADREARMALYSFSMLRRAGVDVDMFIFPDEYHIKWQPAHRDAVYRRFLAELSRWASESPRKCG